MTNKEQVLLLDSWIKEISLRRKLQNDNIKVNFCLNKILFILKYLSNAKHLDEAGVRALDSTLKKVTAFMKKLKNIGIAVQPATLIPELEKLNVSKFLDEIAMNICDAKIKVSDLPSLIDFCVKVTSLYQPFAGILTTELKKSIPFRKSDSIINPSKLRVDLKLVY